MEWTIITDIILALSILALSAPLALGIAQWASRKSFKKIDKQLRWAILPLILLVVTYLVFDKVLPHLFPDSMPTRPDGSGEPSFPSTHVMIVATIFFCISAALPKYTKSKTTITVFNILMFVLTSLVATGRIISNKHSCIDVIGAVVFSFIFYKIYHACIYKKETKKELKDE